MGQHRIDGTRLVTRRSARDQILLAWDYRCAYCGEELGGRPTIDHVVPKACGGPTVPSNLVACCMGCNASKGHQPWREWYRQQPFRSALGEWAILQWLMASQQKAPALWTAEACCERGCEGDEPSGCDH